MVGRGRRKEAGNDKKEKWAWMRLGESKQKVSVSQTLWSCYCFFCLDFWEINESETMKASKREWCQRWQVNRYSNPIRVEPKSFPWSSDKTFISWHKQRPLRVKVTRISGHNSHLASTVPTTAADEIITFGGVAARSVTAGQKHRTYTSSRGRSTVLTERGGPHPFLWRITVLWEVGWTVCLCWGTNPQTSSLS